MNSNTKKMCAMNSAALECGSVAAALVTAPRGRPVAWSLSRPFSRRSFTLSREGPLATRHYCLDRVGNAACAAFGATRDLIQ